MGPKDVNQIVAQLEQPPLAISFDVEAFDEAIRSQGVAFVHYRAMRCPVGMVDQYDLRKTHDDHDGCSNGFLYTVAGEVTCLFTGNSKKRDITDPGLLDGSTVQVTLPRFYDAADVNTKIPIDIAQFDRMYLAEEVTPVTHWELFTASPTGKDKTSFPAVKVTDLVDNTGKRYDGNDFDVVQGYVVWKTQNRPSIDPNTGKGAVCAIRYTYRPYWYVARLLHEVRVTQVEDIYAGTRRVERMPQACMLQREYVFEKEEKKDELTAPDTANPREVRGPSQGSFYPR